MPYLNALFLSWLILLPLDAAKSTYVPDLCHVPIWTMRKVMLADSQANCYKECLTRVLDYSNALRQGGHGGHCQRIVYRNPWGKISTFINENNMEDWLFYGLRASDVTPASWKYGRNGVARWQGFSKWPHASLDAEVRDNGFRIPDFKQCDCNFTLAMSLMQQSYFGNRSECDVGIVSRQLSFWGWEAVFFGSIQKDVRCTYVIDWMPDDAVTQVHFNLLESGGIYQMHSGYQLTVP